MTTATNAPATLGPQQTAVPSEEATTLLLPPSAYSSPSHFEAELEAVFEHSWIHVADTCDLPNPGDYVTCVVGTTPVLVVRSADGELRAFLNVCRHRGIQLMEGSGTCKKQHLKCPYHGWTYTTEGKLAGVPFRDEFEGIDELNLIPLRMAVAEPFVFVCLDENAPAFEQWGGKLLPALERARGSELTPFCRFEYEVAANWKIGVENAMDSYHLPIVHAAGEATHIDIASATIDEEQFGSSASTKLPDILLSIIPGRDHLPEWDASHVRMGSLFPNLVVVLFPGTVMYFEYHPLSAERMRLVSRAFQYGEPHQNFVLLRTAAMEKTNQEDIPIIERVHRGLKARGLPELPFAHRLERRVYHFQKMLQRAMEAAKEPLTPLRSHPNS